MASVLAATSFAAFAETNGVSVSQPEDSGRGDERRERYRRRHEMLMERAMKRGQVVPVVPVVPPPPGAPVPPPPVVAVAPVSLYGNGSANPALAEEPVFVKVQSLAYDESNGRGVLTVEVTGGSFSAANRYIRANIGKLARNDAPGEAAPKIPPDARLEIESITMDEDDFCEVKFKTKGRRQ